MRTLRRRLDGLAPAGSLDFPTMADGAMTPSYRIQINTGPIDEGGLLGRIGLVLFGLGASAPEFFVHEDPPLSGTWRSVMTVYPTIADVGPVSRIAARYLTEVEGREWHLDSMEVVHEPTGRYSFFPFYGSIAGGPDVGGSATPIDQTTDTGRFEVFRGKDGDYYFHLRARNGEIIAASEGYRSRHSALKGIRSIKAHAPGAEVVGL